jgi:hypothetical protein
MSTIDDSDDYGLQPPCIQLSSHSQVMPAVAAVAGGQPLGSSPLGGGPLSSSFPSYTGPVPPTRKCSKRQCTHMLEAPIDLKADGSDYYSQCWQCRGATSRFATKRRKLDSITTGSLIEPTSSSSPSINQFASMRRQLAQAQSMTSLCGTPSSGQFASPPADFTPPQPQFAPLPPRFASPPGQLAPPLGQVASSSTAGTSSTLSNINVQMPDAPQVSVAAPRAPIKPAPPSHVEPSTPIGTSTTGNSATFLPRGKDSGDTLETAAARRERDILQRNHRQRERGGEDVSLTPRLSQFMHPYRYDEPRSLLIPPPPSSQLLTPSGGQGQPFHPFNQDIMADDHFVESPLSRRSSMSSYCGRGRSDSVRPRGSPSRSRSEVRRRSPSSPNISPKSSCFQCSNCSEHRPVSVETPDTEGICNYCKLKPPKYNRDHQLICCHPRHHIVSYADLLDKDRQRHLICPERRGLGYLSSTQMLTQSLLSDPSPSSHSDAFPNLSQYRSTDPFASSQAPCGRGHANIGTANVARQARLDAFQVRDPVLDLNTEDWRDNPALTERDFELLNDFHEKLDQERLETCACCKERWFHMGLDGDRICGSCQKADKDLDEDMPFLYSAANEMDPGPIPPGLEPLTQVEEMLIARVHCFVKVRQVYGVQYKYKGHVVNFRTNTSKVYNRLPLLPQHLDIIVIRPFNWNKDPRMHRQFQADNKVRKHVIKTWLISNATIQGTGTLRLPTRTLTLYQMSSLLMTTSSSTRLRTKLLSTQPT